MPPAASVAGAAVSILSANAQSFLSDRRYDTAQLYLLQNAVIPWQEAPALALAARSVPHDISSMQT